MNDREHKTPTNHTVDAAFQEYVRGKSLAVVGRAEYLKTIEQGELIDSFDIVVRVHNPVPYNSADEARRIMKETRSSSTHAYSRASWDYSKEFVPRELWPKVGKRVDVFYFNVFGVKSDPPSRLEGFLKMIASFKRAGASFLCSESAEHYMLRTEGKIGWQSDVVRETVWDCFRGVGQDDIHWKNLIDAMSSFPFAGTSVIRDILKHDIREVYVTGFPHFLDMPEPPTPFSHERCLDNLKLTREILKEKEYRVDGVMSELFNRYL